VSYSDNIVIFRAEEWNIVLQMAFFLILHTSLNADTNPLLCTNNTADITSQKSYELFVLYFSKYSPYHIIPYTIS
jgi:hypothetical protein